ncbi:transposable element Tcb2 transposase [Trichonephila clavipes]|nr:transposable element Tcb2 transposase [Trichonephila clavipes]
MGHDWATQKRPADHMRPVGHSVATVTDSWPTCHEYEPCAIEDPPCGEADARKRVQHRMPGCRQRRHFQQTDDFTRCTVIGLRREGWSFHQIAADTNRDVSTVHCLWRRWLAQGNLARSRGPGTARVTSAREDRRIRNQAVTSPQATSISILQHVQDSLDVPISTRTISHRLVESGLHSRRPLRTLALTPQRRRARLEWCRSRATWMTEWRNVVFSDESRFCFFNDSQRLRVWRRRGERSNPAVTVERPTARQRGIHHGLGHYCV